MVQSSTPINICFYVRNQQSRARLNLTERAPSPYSADGGSVLAQLY
jgi:hypothetical protein